MHPFPIRHSSTWIPELCKHKVFNQFEKVLSNQAHAD